MKRTKQAASPAEAEDTSRCPNRRQALALGGAAAAAAAVAALGMDRGKKAHAALIPLYLGENNSGPGSSTVLADTIPPVFGFPENAVLGINNGDGVGIRVISKNATAIVGTTDGVDPGADFPAAAIAVLGIAVDPSGVGGGPGTAVGGWSGSGVGVQAASGTGNALEVWGKASFSTAGAGVVPRGSAAASVDQLSVTDQSHVMVTLMGDPGNAAAVVQWVERKPGSGFIVHLRVAVSNETPFTYLIVEPGA